MMMSRIVSRRASSFTITGIESFRINDKLETFQVFKHDGEFVSATLFTFTFALGSTTSVKGHHLFGR